jgi:amino acid transporter
MTSKYFLCHQPLDINANHANRWSSETFVSSYINIPLVLIFYFGWKWFKKTKIVSLEEMPIQHFIDIADASPEPPVKKPVGWRKLNILWS